MYYDIALLLSLLRSVLLFDVCFRRLLILFVLG